jgi:prepilin-type N-terminal cleavage/methylation domain-containing protein
MKRGFTLLELIVVIIIIGILATLAIGQYGRIVERSRGAEARTILGNIRVNGALFYVQNGNNMNGVAPTDLNIGAAPLLPSACRTSHYFYYSYTVITATPSPGLVITANRCTSGGKSPDYVNPDTLNLTSNYSTGVDTWGGNGPY